MGWFENIARSLGLMIHNIKHPEDAKGVDEVQTKVLKKEVEEEHRGNVTLRKTTIEEIEFHGESKPEDFE